MQTFKVCPLLSVAPLTESSLLFGLSLSLPLIMLDQSSLSKVCKQGKSAECLEVESALGSLQVPHHIANSLQCLVF